MKIFEELIMYSRGAKSVGEQIHKSTREAQQIIDKFYSAFPKVKVWGDKTVADAKKNGYVETVYGRRRYIENITKPEYEFEYIVGQSKDFNPLDLGGMDLSTEVSQDEIDYYTKKLSKAFGYRDKEQVKQEAYNEGIKIRDNGGFLTDAIRKCVNSRIQGSAADMSKYAMLKIYQNKEMRKLGFRILLAVHDEIIGEAPIENAKRCGELLSELMITSAADLCTVPQKCDVDITQAWYGDSISI